ncbi:pyridoxal phosphate-dependent aminotransferase [Robertmurraya massiliosenegalensis]|uniref:pyridoxal phosphate-dependent aminotransferase n=1 Tax=Robertmurraya TaxID=2837507 RepID=UPI0039A4B8AE
MLANRLENIGFSEIRKVYEEVTKRQKLGLDTLNLLLGEPDFDTPQKIVEAAIHSLNDGDTHYTSNFGLNELRSILAKKLVKENKIDASANEILITAGASEAIFLAMMALINEGDEVLIPCPTWMNYASSCRIAGGIPVFVPLDGEKSAFSLHVETLEKYVTAHTKMLVIVNPGNPTGMILNIEELEAISKFAIKNDLIVLADEIYEKIIFDDSEHVSIASLPGMKERTITVNGFSKAYAMTGWRLGFVHASENIINGLVRIHQNNISSLSGFTQKGAITALIKAEEDVHEMRAQFNRRRDLVINILNQSHCFDIRPPKGAIYLFLDIKNIGKSSKEFASQLLKETGVAVVPGDAFGIFGEGYVRLSFAASGAILHEACHRIVAFSEHIMKEGKAIQ